MLKKLNWQGYSNNDPYQTIEDIKGVLLTNDAYIINSQMFSDLDLSLSIEIEECKIMTLHDALSSLLNVSDMDISTLNLESRRDWLIFLSVSFSKGKGKLKTEIPLVPG